MALAAHAVEPGQAVVVTTESWSAVQGTAQRFARAGGGEWQKVGEPFPVVRRKEARAF